MTAPRFTLTPVDAANPIADAFGGADGPSSTLLEESLIASPHSVELNRTPTRDYIERFTATEPHIAELFHENSKISSHSGVNVALDEEACAATRRWYVRTAYRPEPGDVHEEKAAALQISLPVADLGGGLARWLHCLESDEVVDAAYPLHLMLLRESALHRVRPDGGSLWLDRYVGPAELQRIRGMLLGPEVAATAPAYLVIAGAPWRYMVYQGPRGYRRTLIHCGRVIAALEAAARDAGVALVTVYDFHDVRLDRALNLDGVDRSALAVLAYLGEAEEEPDGDR